jgi:hypothetical protein
VFPIRDQRGRCIGFGGRAIGDGEPKYLNSPETVLFHKGRELYGLFEARQALTFLTLARLRQRALNQDRRYGMASSRLSSSVWLAAGAVAASGVVALLVRSDFGPPVPFLVAAGAAAALAVVALTSVRSTPNLGALARLAWPWGLALAATLVLRMVVDAFALLDPAEALLARVREGYTVFSDPRRWMLGAGVCAAAVGAGWRGARATGSVRAGILVAMAASLVGACLAVAAWGVLSLRSAPLGFAFDAEGVVPTLVVGTTLGTIGALVGRGRASHEGSSVPRAPFPLPPAP